MNRHRSTRYRWATAAIAATGLLLAGCADDSPDPSQSTPPATSSSPSASLTSTLSAAHQQAVTEATEAVRAYEQTFIDILADPTPTLNDMNKVAAQPQLARDLKNLHMLLSEDAEVVYESTGPVIVASADPVTVDLRDDPHTVVLEACVDATAVRWTENGETRQGVREKSSYHVVRTTYLPAPGWAVSRVLTPRGSEDFPSC